MGKKYYVTRFADAVGLHAESILGASILELYSNNRVLVENIRRVISFDSSQIHIEVSFGLLIMEGEQLVLDYLGEDRILIKGIISTISVK